MRAKPFVHRRNARQRGGALGFPRNDAASGSFPIHPGPVTEARVRAPRFPAPDVAR